MKNWLVSFDRLPFELRAALAGGRGAGSGHRDRTGAVGFGGQVPMVRQRHEHRVAAHQVDPLERFGVAGLGAGEILENHAVGAARKQPAVGWPSAPRGPCPDR